MTPPTTTEVKICGLKTTTEIDAAIDGGADYIGLVLFPPSPRNVSIEEAGRLAEHARGRTRIVALSVDADDALIDRIASDIAPDLLQLHGSEDMERIRRIRTLTQTGVMKAVKVATADDTEIAFRYHWVVDRILFDAKAPKDSPIPGGNGLQFDWHALEPVRGRMDFMLSGGLTPDNVADAIELTGAPAVDVSSGVESAPGVKDPARIRAFLQAAKGL